MICLGWQNCLTLLLIFNKPIAEFEIKESEWKFVSKSVQV